MKGVRKTFFDPLATSKARIQEILQSLPIGSAHPYSPQRVLLCKTASGIEELDISSHDDSFFYNAVDLGEMGEVLIGRMKNFGSELSEFREYDIVQAPAATFEIPIHSGRMTIFAVSERMPTYYDFCLADARNNACCYSANDTFKGITHSGDRCSGNDLLQYVKFVTRNLSEEEYCVFISGFQSVRITRFLGTHPALLVANHEEKLLYIIPVPLDSATIGDATICCPLVIKRRNDSLVCSILPKATTDQPMSCTSRQCQSPSFREAIASADFTIDAPEPILTTAIEPVSNTVDEVTSTLKNLDIVKAKSTAIITTNSVTYPSFFDMNDTQLIKFGTGLEFIFPGDTPSDAQSADVVLPCVFGNHLEGPVLLATGTAPVNVPFLNQRALRSYYNKLKDVVFIVDERMTDNARNLATSWRINALFVVQISPEKKPATDKGLEEVLNAVNVNAVTALAGPQSLVLVQIADRYFFYGGLANRDILDTSTLSFGADVSAVMMSSGMKNILDPRVARMIDLNTDDSILMQTSGQWLKPQDLAQILEDLPVDRIEDLKGDVFTAVPQLQKILNQKDVQELSKLLINTLSAKISKVTGPLRDAYVEFVATEFDISDPESVKKKNMMLGELRKATKAAQTAVGSTISSLGAMTSTQTTSKRTHDLKRLVRQAQIQSNVEAVQSMTFETLAEYLETYADSMGVMLLNIEADDYKKLLASLRNSQGLNASKSCSLDSRILHLNGLDAGIIMEQSQNEHDGPLTSLSGPKQPVMALSRLSKELRGGSMVAWVCWDEFVNLQSPFGVRWVEKCNEPHISALRILMRRTLSQAASSRDYDLQPGNHETGQLMSALLMTAMKKLSAVRTTVPDVVEEAEDTVTRLMRGLFGNFLTTAGSGVRPQSMVWQLFGQDANFDIPTNDADWTWYNTAVKLYPYTGWPRTKFYENLEKFLDKVILRVVTRNENTAEIKMSRVSEMIKYCKLRNIQLEQSRTIITIFMKMLTTEGVDTAAVAARLLAQVPNKLQKQTSSYSRMIRYLEHLAKGGEQRADDNAIAASVYVRRSAAFSKVKTKVSQAWQAGDWDKVKKYCQVMVDTHVKIAAFWHISPDTFKIQNMKTYKELLDADFDGMPKSQSDAWTKMIVGDAEKGRVPWQVGKKREFSDEIEELDESFVHEIMTGEVLVDESQPEVEEVAESQSTEVAATKPMDSGFSVFKDMVKSAFLAEMEKALSADDVCTIINLPASTMHIFAKALNPNFVWNDLGENFKAVILDLLKNRSNRVDSQPAKKLLGLGKKQALQIEGA